MAYGNDYNSVAADRRSYQAQAAENYFRGLGMQQQRDALDEQAAQRDYQRQADQAKYFADVDYRNRDFDYRSQRDAEALALNNSQYRDQRSDADRNYFLNARKVEHDLGTDPAGVRLEREREANRVAFEKKQAEQEEAKKEEEQDRIAKLSRSAAVAANEIPEIDQRLSTVMAIKKTFDKGGWFTANSTLRQNAFNALKPMLDEGASLPDTHEGMTGLLNNLQMELSTQRAALSDYFKNIAGPKAAPDLVTARRDGKFDPTYAPYFRTGRDDFEFNDGVNEADEEAAPAPRSARTTGATPRGVVPANYAYDPIPDSAKFDPSELYSKPAANDYFKNPRANRKPVEVTRYLKNGRAAVYDAETKQFIRYAN